MAVVKSRTAAPHDFTEPANLCLAWCNNCSTSVVPHGVSVRLLNSDKS